MDIRYYFTPVDFSTYYNSGHLTWKYSLGAVVEKNSLALTKENIHKLNIAIVGVPFDSRKEDNYSPQATDKIRAELYQLAKFNNKINTETFQDLPASGSKRTNWIPLHQKGFPL